MLDNNQQDHSNNLDDEATKTIGFDKTKVLEIFLNNLWFWLILVVLLFINSNFFLPDDFTRSKQEIQNIIENYYIGDLPDTEKFNENQLKGYVAALNDPYSAYLTNADNDQFEDNLNERYEGVGIRFERTEKGWVVMETLANSPAESAGVKAQDLLLQVGDVRVDSNNIDDILSLISGQSGTVVSISFLRNGEKIRFDLMREKIHSPLIYLNVRGDIGVIKVVSFGDDLDQEILAIASQIEDNSNIKKLVLDLRQNGGGVLGSAIDLVSYFLPKDTLVVTEQAKKANTEYKTVQKEISLMGYPLVILTDVNTASASEIVAASLVDNRQISTIGQKTYGKGLVQTIFPLKNGNYLKITIAEWLTPAGKKLNKQGLEPTITVPVDQDSLEFVFSEYNW